MVKKRIGLFVRSVAVIVLFSMSFAKPVYAKDYTARLRETLETEPVYLATTVYDLSLGIYKDKKQFKKDYDGKKVVIVGYTKIKTFYEGREDIDIEDLAGNVCAIDTSDSGVHSNIYELKAGQQVVVYGTVKVNGLIASNYTYEIKADHLESGNLPTLPTVGEKVFYPSETFDYVTVDDLTANKRVSFRVPASWNGNYVKSDLTNNGIKGYQYTLNATEPFQKDYPEIFYIFYFTNETYLDKVPDSPSESDLKAIEKAIIKNILEAVGDDSYIKVESFKDMNGTSFHYCPVSYRPADGKDYRLEFFFRPDEKGITCMLYLYFPKEEAVHHVKEAAYLLSTMEVK